VNRRSASRPAPRPRSARRGRSWSSDWGRLDLLWTPAGTDPTSVSDNFDPALALPPTARSAGLLAGQATRTSPIRTPTGKPLDFGGNVGEPGPRPYSASALDDAGLVGRLAVVLAEHLKRSSPPAGFGGERCGIVPTALTMLRHGRSGNVAGAGPRPATTTLLTSGNNLGHQRAKTTAPTSPRPGICRSPGAISTSPACCVPASTPPTVTFFDHQYIGYGGHIGFDFKPGWLGWVKDDFTVHFTVGAHDTART